VIVNLLVDVTYSVPQPAHPDRGGARHELRRHRRRRRPLASRARRRRLLRRRLARRPFALLGFCASLRFALVAISRPWSRRTPVATDFNAILAQPSARTMLGTDELGRDILSRIIWGPGLDAGRRPRDGAGDGDRVPIGLVAGYYRGWDRLRHLAAHRRAARVPVPDPRGRARGDPGAVAPERDDRARGRRRAGADPVARGETLALRRRTTSGAAVANGAGDAPSSSGTSSPT
jgi:hypothetical protein